MISIEERLKDLSPCLYDGLIISATTSTEPLAPGETATIEVEIQNDGDEPVIYVQGSGRFITPQAVFIDIEGLQPVAPADHMGPMTMDYVTKPLAPGEMLSFTFYVRAVEPSDEFDNLAFDLFIKEQTYIADLPWKELHKKGTTLKAAQPGEYEGQVYFTYAMPSKEEGMEFVPAAEGYISVPFIIQIEK